ncbi:metal-sensing transcriptional repressor [Aquella oligotrophica]|uniref:Metal resistance protein n=1 Tax=Aquella oligotrophica TaxID=2067065 RepID=A0A2I7N6G4_9NEIS|nr:metal-sensing transcriptional repressor [Aquella oligotrophica]AUR52031.1 metal resistance protein [Aquella oligotrophica]
MQHEHKKHKEITSRLKRVNGHLLKVIAMLENDEECIDIAQQLHAVERALNGAKKALIYNHVNDCLEEKSGTSKSVLEEFKQITKYM